MVRSNNQSYLADDATPRSAAAAAASSSTDDDAVEEDELFGDLVADDHESSHREQQDVNPQTAATSDVTSRYDANGLAGHEIRANENNFHKLGYLEAYDAAKDTMLQAGFEAGYRETVVLAKDSVGETLGKLVAHRLVVTSPSSKDKQMARKVASTVRSFLDEQTDTPDALLASLVKLELDVEKMRSLH